MLTEMCGLAQDVGIHLTVDAEESERLEMSLDIIERAVRQPRFRGWDGFGLAVQAYSKRARPVVAWANMLAGELGQRWNVRLVKGAYWDSEIKRTQVEGLADYPLFTRKAATDVSYLAVARDMLDAENIRPAFASHNALTVATLIEWAGNSRDFEFQRLHGMGEGLYERLVRERGYRTRIYAPVGGHRDLLAYLVRRLLENGANSSFVHQLADERLSEADILADPVAKVAAVGGTRHPSIPLPSELFGDRKNSEGLDLSDREVLARTVEAVNALPLRDHPQPRAGGIHFRRPQRRSAALRHNHPRTWTPACAGVDRISGRQSRWPRPLSPPGHAPPSRTEPPSSIALPTCWRNGVTR
jgi:RHH-type proline utilization regulon transcriptional repressor/proline dehydrogenase/delta 1-pyrroline-5-carboxylate dehydrogenase